MTLNKIFFYLLVSLTRESLFCFITEDNLPLLSSPAWMYKDVFNNWIRRRNINEDCQVHGVYDCDCEYNKFFCSYENLMSEEGRKPH